MKKFCRKLSLLSSNLRQFLHTLCSPRPKPIKTADPFYKPRAKRTAEQIDQLKANVEPLSVHVLCGECRKTTPLVHRFDKAPSPHVDSLSTVTTSATVSIAPRIIVIGDIHGCAREFQALLEKVSFVKGADVLILTGDIMIKGGGSREALHIAMENDAFFVRGNHDWEILRRHERASPFVEIDTSGNAATHDRVAQCLSQVEVDYLASAPHMLYIPMYHTLIVHAAVKYPHILGTNAYDAMHGRNYVVSELDKNAGANDRMNDVHDKEHRLLEPSLRICAHCSLNTLEGTSAAALLGPEITAFEERSMAIHEDISKGEPWASTYPVEHSNTELPFVIFGHDARRGLQVCPNAYGIDTGCAYGRKLTALVLPGRELFSVNKFE